jgi:hypothetical protein
MSVNPEVLFHATKKRWPKIFKIRVATSESSNLICEPDLLDVYRLIERAIPETDEWGNLAAWAFHQALWGVVEKRKVAGGSVGRDDVSFKEFDRMMRFNLSDDTWLNFRKEYESQVAPGR